MTQATINDVRPIGKSYWALTRHPFTCLIFLLPLLVVYEIGVLRLGGDDPTFVRNGADHWMRNWLQQAGLDHPALLPGLVVGVLLAWQVCGKFSWRISAETLVGMYAESLLFAFCLILVGQVQDVMFQHYGALVSTALTQRVYDIAWTRAVSFVGAGIYEEVLFRLCLMPVCYAALRLLLLPSKWAAVGCILVTSVLFAAAHYSGPGADRFSAFEFSFRAIAGLIFALLFTLRGFGIAVGCHAAYDVLVGVILQSNT